MATHWARCKAEALVCSLREKLAEKKVEVLVNTLSNRQEEIEMQIIG